jgi:hypothetical protein
MTIPAAGYRGHPRRVGRPLGSGPALAGRIGVHPPR